MERILSTDLASLCVEQQYDDEEKEIVLFHYLEECLPEHRLKLEMMCMLYSMKVALWSLNQNQMGLNKNFDFLWLFDCITKIFSDLIYGCNMPPTLWIHLV